MEKTMRGVCLNEQGAPELRRFPVPEAEGTFVRVRISHAGVCATDLGYIRHGSPKLRLPVILGHEACGTVDAVGAEVRDLKLGDRVVVLNDFYLCGACEPCLSGATNLCDHRRSIGSGENGAFAEYIRLPRSAVLALPDEIDDVSGALLEPLACAVHALIGRAKIAEGSTVLVVGPGALGACTALTAKALGCTVIAAGLHEDAWRLERLGEMGVDVTTECSGDALKALVLEKTHGRGVDAAVEGAGSYRAAQTCLDLVKKRGVYAQLGLLHGAAELDLSALATRELTLVGSYAKTMADWETAIRLAREGRVQLLPLASETLPLERHREAFEHAAGRNAFRVLFDPQA